MSGHDCYKMLSVICPMHLVFDCEGKITSAGPTAHKIFSDGVIGLNFLDLFEIKRPREISTMAGLLESAASKLNLRLRTPPHRQLKGVLMPGPEEGRLVVNLSFGIYVVDAVQDYNLTAADFAPTDLTVEMLYLVEAKSAAMEASRQLNERLQVARVAAEEQALTDTLTGLQNRRGMDLKLQESVDKRKPFAVMHIDLDYFKAVNDTLGHAAGDAVLQNVADVMLSETREEDVVSRVGGDEFVILFHTKSDRENLSTIARRIIAKLETPFTYLDKECRISASIGIVVSADYKEPNADQMLGDADTATYAAKHAGRGCHIFFAPELRLDSEPVQIITQRQA